MTGSLFISAAILVAMGVIQAELSRIGNILQVISTKMKEPRV